jgi:hypothetical protein
MSENGRAKAEIELLKIENTSLLVRQSSLLSEVSAYAEAEKDIGADLYTLVDLPSVIDIYSRSTELELCDDDSLKKIESWLYFLVVYGEAKPHFSHMKKSDLIKKVMLNFSVLNDLTPSQSSHLRNMVDDLRDYHSKIVSVENWNSVLERAPTNGSYLNENIMNYLYLNGANKTGNSCFSKSLQLGVNSIANHSHGHFGMPYETWLYTFWLRRFNEGLFIETEMALKVLSYMLPGTSKIVSKKMFYWPKMDDTEIVEDLSLNEFYAQYFIARNSQEKALVWLDKKNYKLKGMKLYGTSSVGRVYSFMSEIEGSLMDEMSTSYTYEFTSDIAISDRILFLSESPSQGFTNTFKKSFIEIQEKEEIASFFGAIHELNWNPKMYGGKTVSCDHNPTVKKFSNGKKEIFIISKECTWYSGDGMQGPSMTAVITRQPDKSLVIDFSRLSFGGGLEISGDFIADEDNDGKLEVMIQNTGGLDSNEILVELDKASWSVIRLVSTYSEGGYERFHERAPNNALLESL